MSAVKRQILELNFHVKNTADFRIFMFGFMWLLRYGAYNFHTFCIHRTSNNLTENCASF